MFYGSGVLEVGGGVACYSNGIKNGASVSRNGSPEKRHQWQSAAWFGLSLS